MKFSKRAGTASAIAAVLLAAASGTTGAIAQRVQARFPVVDAVLTSATENLPTTSPLAPAPRADVVEGQDVVSAPRTLAQMVSANRKGAPLTAQEKCLATAVYFEAMGESLHGQLAVANVVINRANSNRYPSSWCGVVKQPAQFSFVRNGRFPRIRTGSEAWARAQAIARVASQNLKSVLPSDVLWYHADYVRPSWRRNLTRAETIGSHIFYRT